MVVSFWSFSDFLFLNSCAPSLSFLPLPRRYQPRAHILSAETSNEREQKKKMDNAQEMEFQIIPMVESTHLDKMSSSTFREQIVKKERKESGA